MVTRSRTAALVALTPAPVERVQRYYAEGPSAYYEGDVGAIGGVQPLRWRGSADGDRMAVVEVSFEYRTKGQGPFEVSVGVGDPTVDPGDDGTGGDVIVRPQMFELAPAARRTATTVRFLAPLLEAGKLYAAQVGVNSVAPDHGRNLIRTRKVLVTVELADH